MFAAIADGKTEHDRASAVLRWFIVSGHERCVLVIRMIDLIARAPSKASTPPETNLWALRKSVSVARHRPFNANLIMQTLESGAWRVGELRSQLSVRLILRRLFYGYWPANETRGGKTTLVVEQVSHHPPITAYHIENAAKGVKLTGHNGQKTSFSGMLCPLATLARLMDI